MNSWQYFNKFGKCCNLMFHRGKICADLVKRSTKTVTSVRNLALVNHRRTVAEIVGVRLLIAGNLNRFSGLEGGHHLNAFQFVLFIFRFRLCLAIQCVSFFCTVEPLLSGHQLSGQLSKSQSVIHWK